MVCEGAKAPYTIARQRILPNAAGVLRYAPQVHSSLAAKGGFFITRAASIKTYVS